MLQVEAHPCQQGCVSQQARGYACGHSARADPCRRMRHALQWNDASVSPVIRQTLLHWAYELTAEDFDRMRQQL